MLKRVSIKQYEFFWLPEIYKNYIKYEKNLKEFFGIIMFCVIQRGMFLYIIIIK
jgi:hypothetical protein